MGQVSDLQKRAWQNKLAKGFNITNVEREFNYTYAELAEAYDAYRKGKEGVADELADVGIFLLSLAEMLEVDLEQAILAKMKKNEAREYEIVNGRHQKKETL